MAVIVREQVTLSDHTTLRLGGPAAAFIEASTDEQLVAVVRAADLETEPVLVLGGGSNLVVADEGFPGVVVHVATRGTTITPDGDGVAVTIAAGEDWDALVQRCVEEELSGLECMSGIPGLAGATPIQNVGAYVMRSPRRSSPCAPTTGCGISLSSWRTPSAVSGTGQARSRCAAPGVPALR